jgi:carbon-monoxide dehydrogenase medium subunit
MYDFAYCRPTSLKEASELFASLEEPRFLSGGQSLIPVLKLRLAAPSHLIDLGRLTELQGIRREGDFLRVGAGISHGELASNPLVKSTIPGLAAMAGEIGDPQVRAMGTLGGSLAHNDPAADPPAAALALEAEIVTDRRNIPVDQFFRPYYETALEPGEIIVAVRFPIPEHSGYAKFPQLASRFPLVGVFVAKRGGEVRVAVTGAGGCVFRASELEARLSLNFTPAALEGATIPENGLLSDIHGDSAYRAHLITIMAKRAVAASL